MGFQKFGTGDVIGEDKPERPSPEEHRSEMDEKLREDGWERSDEEPFPQTNQ